MKKLLQQIKLTALIVCAISIHVTAQNWQYVGSPFINNTVGVSNSLYFADLESNTSGDLYVGYW